MPDQQIGLEAAIEQALANPRRWPGFPPALEAAFVLHSGVTRSQGRVFVGLLALAVYDFFFLIDYLLIPDIALRAAVVRFCIMTPLGIVVMLGAKKIGSRFYLDVLPGIVSLCYAFSVLYLFRESRHQGVVYIFGYVLVPIFANLMMQLLFQPALITSMLSSIVFALVIGTMADMPLATRATVIAVVEAVILVTLITNYRMEQYQRLIYASTLREQLRAQRLAAQNRELQDLSNLDGLTGLANRRHLDAAGPVLWRAAADASTPLAVLMVDVDHFKRLNDRLGHLAGDVCLIALAGLLRAHVRQSIDLVARYGGEEFCVVMPGLDAYNSLQVAQRLCAAVAASPIVGEGIPPQSITVSIGHAACRPGAPHRPDQEQSDRWAAMLAAADAALYAAKSSGRNRVRTASARASLLPMAP